METWAKTCDEHLLFAFEHLDTIWKIIVSKLHKYYGG